MAKIARMQKDLKEVEAESTGTPSPSSVAVPGGGSNLKNLACMI